MRAMTVSGPIDAAALGVVMPHEHLHCTASFLCQGDPADRRAMEEIPADRLRVRPMDYVTNLDMRDEQTARSELERFRDAGGQTIVELTTPDTGRDIGALARLASASGVKVVAGTAFYIDAAHPAYVRDESVNAIAQRLVRDIVDGIDGTRIRAGIIGEVGTGDPLCPGEDKVLRAAARAQLETGCPMNIHFAAGCREVFHVIDVLRQAGLRDLSRVAISHMDVAIDIAQHRAVAEAGAYVEYDTFGHECYPDSRGNLMPTDRDRVAALAQLDHWGLLERILVSQDVCFRTQWTRYGGKGYANLLTGAAALMDEAGLGPDKRHKLMVENPARLLAFLP